MGNLESDLLGLHGSWYHRSKLSPRKARKDAHKRTKEAYENSIVVKYYNKRKNKEKDEKE